MTPLSFKRHRFPPRIIRQAVWIYARYTPSYRDIEEMLAERGVDVSYETIRCWFVKFGTATARNLRHLRPLRSTRGQSQLRQLDPATPATSLSRHGLS